MERKGVGSKKEKCTLTKKKENARIKAGVWATYKATKLLFHLLWLHNQYLLSLLLPLARGATICQAKKREPPVLSILSITADASPQIPHFYLGGCLGSRSNQMVQRRDAMKIQTYTGMRPCILIFPVCSGDQNTGFPFPSSMAIDTTLFPSQTSPMSATDHKWHLTLGSA